MGQLDQFAKDTFALEAASVTHGGVSWQLPPELRMSEVQLDGLRRVHDPSLLMTHRTGRDRRHEAAGGTLAGASRRWRPASHRRETRA